MYDVFTFVYDKYFCCYHCSVVETIESFKVETNSLCNRRCNLNEAEEMVKFISEQLIMQTADGQI